MARVLEPGIRAQGAQECVLERILRAFTTELPDEERPDLVAVALVEALEGGYAHHRRYNARAPGGVRLPPLTPETHYAKSGAVNIAYQVVGDGPLDLLYVPGRWRLYSVAS